MKSPARVLGNKAERHESEGTYQGGDEQHTSRVEGALLTVPPRGLVISSLEADDSFLRNVALYGQASWQLINLEKQPALRPQETVDVVVILLATSCLKPLTWALSMHVLLQEPEYVIILDDQNDPASFALQALGVGRLMSRADGATWLASNLADLTCLARARRLMKTAAERLSQPTDTDKLSQPGQGLFAAEQRFREAYVRAVLATTTSRAVAAQRARLPYRTFCHILNKLGGSDQEHGNGSGDFGCSGPS
jgi:hypothetical protein